MIFYYLAITFLFALNIFLFWRVRVWRKIAVMAEGSLTILSHRARDLKEECRLLHVEIAAVRAPKTIEGARGVPIRLERGGMNAVWVCDAQSPCSKTWEALQGRRRPTHRRAGHEKLLKAAVTGSGWTIPAPCALTIPPFGL